MANDNKPRQPIRRDTAAVKRTFTPSVRSSEMIEESMILGRDMAVTLMGCTPEERTACLDQLMEDDPSLGRQVRAFIPRLEQLLEEGLVRAAKLPGAKPPAPAPAPAAPTRPVVQQPVPPRTVVAPAPSIRGRHANR